MSLRTKSLPVLAAVFCAALALPTRAQHLSLSLGRNTHHGSFSINFGIPLARPSYSYCEPRRSWVPGHYETRCESVWVAGCSRQVWVAPEYEWRVDACGRPYRVCVRAGAWRTVTDPGHYESRDVQVWVPGGWRTA